MMRIPNAVLIFGLALVGSMGHQASAQSAAQAQTPAAQGDPTQQKASAARFEDQCPEEVRTKQAPAAPIKGWATHVETLNSRQIFTAAYLYEGHPKDGLQMVPSAEATEAASATGTTYTIPAGKDVFLVCYYGNTLVRLIQKLPKGLNSCVVKYSETLGHVQKAVCE